MNQTEQNEIERRILGACMLRPDAYEVAQGLTEDHFGNLAHHSIWEAIDVLARSGQPFDVVTVAGLMREDGPSEEELKAVASRFGLPVEYITARGIEQVHEDRTRCLIDLVANADFNHDITADVLTLLDRKENAK